MRLPFALLVVFASAVPAAESFLSTTHRTAQVGKAPAPTVMFGKKRMARKQKDAIGKPKEMQDAINKAAQKKTAKNKPVEEDDERTKYLAEAEAKMKQRPELSTMIVDEETGIEMIQQGQSILDVVTRKAVKLSDMGPEYRLAQMFPGVPPDIREKYRFDWNSIEVPTMVEQLRNACSVKLDNGSRGIPPHPSVANSGIDFVLANRDYLGKRMKRTIGRITMREMSLGNTEKGKQLKQLWQNFLTLENHISAPFRQILQDAEGRIGPNFGNLDLQSYAGGDLYERVGNYLVLKGMVAHWEKKVVDADFIEKTPVTPQNKFSVLATGDPRRYLPNPPILFTLKECTQVCAMAQQMCQKFVETEELFSDFPPEIVFMEEAFKVQGGTALRKFMIEEFCPARGITPEGLREGVRRLHQQLDNMQIDPYGDIANKIEDLHGAMAVGTEDARDPYADYLLNPDTNGPGFIQTYTYNHPKQSIVRFLDNRYPSVRDDGFLGLSLDDDDDDDGEVSFIRCRFIPVQSTIRVFSRCSVFSLSLL
jgi:hypothetical protein